MKNVRMTILLVAAVLTIATGQGFGWTQYKDGGTHNIGSTINDDVWVDYQAPSMQTTVNLLDGGTIPNPYKLQGYNESSINISGGSVDWFYTYDNSQVTISGGSINLQLNANNNSHVAMSGGEIKHSLVAYDNSHVIMSDGIVTDLSFYDNSLVTVSGGSINGELHAAITSLVNWSGGTIGQSIQLTHQAILAIDGSNFAIDGIPFSSGEITSIFGGQYYAEPFRRLTGTLANGDIINNQFRIGNDASITLVPEPATILLFALGGFVLRRKRKITNHKSEV